MKISYKKERNEEKEKTLEWENTGSEKEKKQTHFIKQKDRKWELGKDEIINR